MKGVTVWLPPSFVSLVGDADTQAAIAGSIAEAFYDMPVRFIGDVEKRLDKYLLSVLNNFNNKG